MRSMAPVRPADVAADLIVREDGGGSAVGLAGAVVGRGMVIGAVQGDGDADDGVVGVGPLGRDVVFGEAEEGY